MDDGMWRDQLINTWKEVSEIALNNEQRQRILNCLEWGAESMVHSYLQALIDLKHVETAIDVEVTKRSREGLIPGWQNDLELLQSTWRQFESLPGGFVDDLLDHLDTS